MQRFNYFLVSIAVSTICLLSCQVMAQTSTQTSLVVISAVAPVYTPAARAVKIRGDFFVGVEIDRDGKVTSAKVADKTPKLIRAALEEAARSWQFVSDENGKKKRSVQLTFTLSYVPKASAFNANTTVIFYPPYKIEVQDNTEPIY